MEDFNDYSNFNFPMGGPVVLSAEDSLERTITQNFRKEPALLKL
jgi:hypothetical protein